MEKTDKRKVVRVKKPFMIGAALLLGAVGLQATRVPPCAAIGTSAASEGYGSAGCTINGKTLSNFTPHLSSTVIASDINYRTNSGGEDGFVIGVTKAPEPGFYGLLAAGVAGIFMLAKRRKKAT